MAELALVRVDQRGVHGVICVTWSSRVAATKIIVIDDASAKNAFLKKIMESSSSLVPCNVVTFDDAVQAWKENQFGEGRVLLIFKSVEVAKKAKEAGLDYQDLQIGWITAEPQRTKVDEKVNLSQEEVDMLGEIANTGVNIYFQYSPQFPVEAWKEKLKGKFKGI